MVSLTIETMDDTSQNGQEVVTDRASALYVESLGVSLADMKIRTEIVDVSKQRSALQIGELRKQSLRLASRLRQMDLRLGKLPAKV